jgi:hypothetical protein
MAQTGIVIRRGQLVAVLVANAILWGAAILVMGTPMLAGAAAISLISIGTLFRAKPKDS